MRIISLAISVLCLSVGCYQDKGPTITVRSMTSGVEFTYHVSEGDWFFEKGKWKDSRNLVIPANANSVAVLEEYLGPKRVAQDKKLDKKFK